MFILDLNTDEIQLLAIDDFGNKDGECHIKMDDVNFVIFWEIDSYEKAVAL